jgi:hypothetical protein
METCKLKVVGIMLGVFNSKSSDTMPKPLCTKAQHSCSRKRAVYLFGLPRRAERNSGAALAPVPIFYRELLFFRKKSKKNPERSEAILNFKKQKS